MFNIFRSSVNDLKIFKILEKKVYIRNGVGFGFISDKELYHNGLLEIGFGRTTSGRGDWGGGFDRASTCPLTITIDRNYTIHKLDTDSFYNSDNSKKVEKEAIKLMKRLKEGDAFVVKDPFLKNGIDELFKIIPCKHHIGWDVFEHEHMLEHNTNVEERGEYNIADAECINAAIKREKTINKVLESD